MMTKRPDRVVGGGFSGCRGVMGHVGGGFRLLHSGPGGPRGSAYPPSHRRLKYRLTTLSCGSTAGAQCHTPQCTKANFQFYSNYKPQRQLL